MTPAEPTVDHSIATLLPRGRGHQFVCYADACSGIPGAPHEQTFAAVNSVIAHLDPQPEFICFPGDEIRGLLTDDAALREQWRYWFEHEMRWLNRQRVPLYHTTGNHTTYDAHSESVFHDVMRHLPRNGPPGQEGLAYFVRHDDLLLVFVNTLWSGLGGEGRVETDWLAATLHAHGSANHKLVFGHHPAFPVNGFSGSYQRELAPESARQFWQILVEHEVEAYICSHILAFDVQVHQGVLQIVTAGAGTAHRMPEEIEYLHCMQLALDDTALRYQVLDTQGQLREWLSWPPDLTNVNWQPFNTNGGALDLPSPSQPTQAHMLVWTLEGIAASTGLGDAQTLAAGWDDSPGLSAIWVGLLGPEQRLGVLLSPEPGRSPHLWHGPTLQPGEPFTLQLGIHTGMGPGGLLWRADEESPWTSLNAASPWGAERLHWPPHWAAGHDKRGATDRPYRGRKLKIRWTSMPLELPIP